MIPSEMIQEPLIVTIGQCFAEFEDRGGWYNPEAMTRFVSQLTALRRFAANCGATYAEIVLANHLRRLQL